MKTLKDLVEEEKRHYMKCRCGEYFDMRNLEDVFAHLHSGNLPKAEYSYSVKVGEPVAYLTRNRRIILT